MILLYACGPIAVVALLLVLALDWCPMPDWLYRPLDRVAGLLVGLVWAMFIIGILVVVL